MIQRAILNKRDMKKYIEQIIFLQIIIYIILYYLYYLYYNQFHFFK